MKIFLHIFFLCVIFTAPLEMSFAAERSITLKDFINAAEKHDPRFKKIMGGKDRLDFILNESLPSRGLNFSVRGEKGIDFRNDTETSLLTGQITKDFLETGTAITLSQTQTSRPDRQENVTEFRLRQDLYRNMFGRDTRLRISALQQTEDIIRLETLEAYEDYLELIFSSFVELRKLYLDLELAKASHREALRMFEDLSQKRKKHVANQTDVDRGELQLILRQEILTSKEKSYEAYWKEITRITGQSTIRVPTHNLDKLESIAKEILSSAKNHSLQTRKQSIAQIRENIATKEATIAEREHSPNVSFIAGYQIDESERFRAQVNRNEAVLGLVLDIPIGNTKTSALASKARFEHQQAIFDKEILQKDEQKQREELYLHLIEAQDRVNLSRRKIKLMENIYKADEQRFEYGRLELSRLIEISTSLNEYRFMLQSQLLDYHRLIIRWLSLNDKLIDYKEKL